MYKFNCPGCVCSTCKMNINTVSLIHMYMLIFVKISWTFYAFVTCSFLWYLGIPIPQDSFCSVVLCSLLQVSLTHMDF